MYVLSFPALADIVVQLQEKAVDIRIIVDGREDEALRSQVGRLSNRGIRIRQNEESYSILMHNKFAILDGSLLLTGSFNWTKTAVLLNYDNILVTSQPTIVEQYQSQFDHLWSKFRPYRVKYKWWNLFRYSYMLLLLHCCISLNYTNVCTNKLMFNK